MSVCAFLKKHYLCSKILYHEKIYPYHSTAIRKHSNHNSTNHSFPSTTLVRAKHLPVQPNMPTGEGVSTFRQYGLFPRRCHMVLGLCRECIDRDSSAQQGALRRTALAQRRSATPTEVESRKRTGTWLITPNRCIYRRSPCPTWCDSVAQWVL